MIIALGILIFIVLAVLAVLALARAGNTDDWDRHAYVQQVLAAVEARGELDSFERNV